MRNVTHSKLHAQVRCAAVASIAERASAAVAQQILEAPATNEGFFTSAMRRAGRWLERLNAFMNARTTSASLLAELRAQARRLSGDTSMQTADVMHICHYTRAWSLPDIRAIGQALQAAATPDDNPASGGTSGLPPEPASGLDVGLDRPRHDVFPAPHIDDRATAFQWRYDSASCCPYLPMTHFARHTHRQRAQDMSNAACAPLMSCADADTDLALCRPNKRCAGMSLVPQTAHAALQQWRNRTVYDDFKWALAEYEHRGKMADQLPTDAMRGHLDALCMLLEVLRKPHAAKRFAMWGSEDALMHDLVSGEQAHKNVRSAFELPNDVPAIGAYEPQEHEQDQSTQGFVQGLAAALQGCALLARARMRTCLPVLATAALSTLQMMHCMAIAPKTFVESAHLQQTAAVLCRQDVKGGKASAKPLRAAPTYNTHPHKGVYPVVTPPSWDCDQAPPPGEPADGVPVSARWHMELHLKGLASGCQTWAPGDGSVSQRLNLLGRAVEQLKEEGWRLDCVVDGVARFSIPRENDIESEFAIGRGLTQAVAFGVLREIRTVPRWPMRGPAVQVCLLLRSAHACCAAHTMVCIALHTAVFCLFSFPCQRSLWHLPVT